MAADARESLGVRPQFFARWYSRDLRPSFLITPYSVVDILSFGPFLALLVGKYALGSEVDPFDISVFGTLRLLTVLRLQRFVKNRKVFTAFQRGLGLRAVEVQPYQLELSRVCLSLLTLISLGSGLIYQFESDVNPAVPDVFAAVYFAVTTLTTVGYGDITPVTPAGRFITSIYILAGAAIIPFQLAQLGEAILGRGGKGEASGAAGGSAMPPLPVRFPLRPGAVDVGRGGQGALSPNVPLWASQARDSGEGESAMADAGSTQQGLSSTFKVVACQSCGESVHVREARFCFLCGGSLPES